MSSTKPGVSISRPPTRISTPSASSLGGIRRSWRAIAQRLPGPAALALDQPGAEDAVGDQQQDRPPGADHLADLDDHVDLDQRHHHEGHEQQPPREAPSPVLVSCSVQRPGPDLFRRLFGARPAARRRAGSPGAALLQPPAGDPAQRLGGHLPAHLRVAAHPLDELDRHLDTRSPARTRAEGQVGLEDVAQRLDRRGRSPPASYDGTGGSRPWRRAP